MASESLSGTVFFEIGDQMWGNGRKRRRMVRRQGGEGQERLHRLDGAPDRPEGPHGYPGIALPSFTTNASQIMDDDVAAVSLNYQSTKTWPDRFLARPYNDNSGYKWNGDKAGYQNYMDNMDVFAVLLPLTFDGFRLTPWAMYAASVPTALMPTTPTTGKAWAFRASSIWRACCLPVARPTTAAWTCTAMPSGRA